MDLYPNSSPDDLATDMFAQQTWLPAHMFAKRQLEEIFCDVMGLRLFSEAYLHAFAYLLSPCIPGERSSNYPTIQSRVAYLMRGAQAMGVNAPADYAELFDEQMEPTNPVVKLLVLIADSAVAELVPGAIDRAIACAQDSAVPQKSDANVAKIRADFQMVMPAAGNNALVDIINAGWECFHDARLWSNSSHIRDEDRSRLLNDLVLKSLEVAEYSQRIGAP